MASTATPPSVPAPNPQYRTMHVNPRLPLIEGVLPLDNSAERIIEDALRSEEAAIVLQRNRKRFHSISTSTTTTGIRPPKTKKRRIDNNNNNEFKVQTRKKQSRNQQHWLWRAMASYNVTERRTVTALLLQTPPGLGEHQRHGLVQQLVRMLKYYYASNRHTVPPLMRSRWTLEWISILETLLFQNDAFVNTMALHWNWLTQTLWNVAVVPADNKVDAEQMAALVHLIYSMTLAYAVSTAPNEEPTASFDTTTTPSGLLARNSKWLWSDRNTFPLAVLIAAYHKHSVGPTCQGQVLSVDLLGRLVDPKSHPHVVMTTVKPEVTSPEVSTPDAQIAMDLEEDEDVVVEENVEMENKESPRKDSEFSQESTVPIEHKDDDEEDDEDDDEEDDDDEDDHHRNIPDEDDEEIDTGDEDDDDNENNDNDGDDDEMDVIREDDMSHFEHVLGGLEVEEAQVDVDLDHIAEEPVSQETKARSLPSSSDLVPSVPEREVLYVRASMQVLSEQYPHVHSPNGAARNDLLSLEAENSLLDAINKIVKPPQKPLNTRIVMRRAPTQEEFFRGSLTRNPITANMLKPSSGTSNGDIADPTIGDLRQHIADGLQMSDSAELIEIIVANKILDVNLKIRVVHDVLWRKHLMENSQSSSTGYPGRSFFSAGSGLSMILSSDFGERSSSARRGITADTPTSALPPLVVTYRLAGVDGEATEDTVSVGDLVDPQAPSQCTSPQELEMLLEKEYGNTRMVTEGRGVAVLLRSVQFVVCDTLRKVRRDDILNSSVNESREKFKQSPPCPALVLLMHCSKLPSNRKKLLQARAPTILLSLLMDVLKTLEGGSVRAAEVVKSNPTAKTLQELIESLTSDISASGSTDEAEADGYESDVVYDASSMSLLLESIETISLSPPLRSVIAKLLPFLTYGQEDLCRELANHFYRNLIVDEMESFEQEPCASSERSILLGTFVQTAISLPSNDVCNSLRVELINCGLIDRLVDFVMKEIPKLPPTWSPALWGRGELPPTSDKNHRNTSKKLVDQWRKFIARGGLRTAVRMLLGLSKGHYQTQIRICKNPDFVRSIHWLEATSDSAQANVSMDGLGLLAETLLDEIAGGNDEMKKLVGSVRSQTRERKKEMAQERRAQALAKMTKFGGLPNKEDAAIVPHATGVRGATASILAPVLGFFRDSNPSESASAQASPGANKISTAEKPSWLAEAEMMEDEDGLTCAVCQEGRTLQPSELLGLYAYVKKVTLPIESCGFSADIEGWSLLKSLPSELPGNLPGKKYVKEWFLVGKAAGDALDDPPVRASAKRKSEVFTTTVSAGNAIHLSCHQRARQADRNHPKAPKSEWEGAALRNNRVSCNVILPLVSSKSSKVPLIAVDSALSDHQTAVANLLGSNPRSLLWTVLHDVRLLMLRIAYGESLNSDCGGGSLISNCQLIFYQLQLADTFDKDAQADQPEKSQHAHCLSAGYLAACAIIAQGDVTPVLNRGVAESSILSSVTAILFHNSNAEGEKDVSNGKIAASKPHPKRRWTVAKDSFLKGLLLYAGRRKALGAMSSGCQTLAGRKRSSSFAEWDEGYVDTSRGLSRSFASNRRNAKPSVQDFQNVLRPMITMYALLDQLSEEFVVYMEDRNIEESAQRLARKVEECQRSTNILELLKKAKVTIEHSEMLEWVQKGMAFAM